MKKRTTPWPSPKARKVALGLTGSATWNPASIPDGDAASGEVTVTGAQMGDFVIPSFSLDVDDLDLHADVTSENTVTCIMSNSTGRTIDLASGTVYVLVFERI